MGDYSLGACGSATDGELDERPSILRILCPVVRGMVHDGSVSDSSDPLCCSFCGKNQKQVKKLIAGPGIFICDECVVLCYEIIEQELHGA